MKPARQHVSETPHGPEQETIWDFFESDTRRLASFARYPRSAVKSSVELASSGFFYIGDGINDKVKCYFCNVMTEGWRQTDDVNEVHKNLSPACPRVSMQLLNNVASGRKSGSPGEPSGCENQPVVSSTVISGTFGSASLNEASVQSPVALSTPGDLYSMREEILRGRVDTNTLSAHNPSQMRREQERNSSLSQPSSILRQSLLATRHAHDYPILGEISARLNYFSELPVAIPRFGTRGRSASETTRSSRNDGIIHQQSFSADTNPEPRHPIINSQIYAIPASVPRETQSATTNITSTSSVPELTYQTLGVQHEKPKYLQQAILATRLLSFEPWPEVSYLDVEDLAKAGLYYAGYGDCCRCFFCGGGLRNWEAGDNPYVEHARWFEKCAYIRHSMGQEFVDVVQDLKSESEANQITYETVVAEMGKKGHTIRSMFDESQVANDPAVRAVVYYGYSLETVSKAALELRRNGVSLSADEILKQLKENESTMNGGATAQSNHSFDEMLQTLKQENDGLRSNLICKICMNREVRVVFLPCGHLIACQECSYALIDCPVCRAHIRGSVVANI